MKLAETKGFFTAGWSLILYAVALGALLWFLHWLQSRLLILHSATELYVSAIAVTFTALGIWLAKKLTDPKVEKVVVEKEVLVFAPVDFSPDQKAIAQANLSPRELEVLELMARGMSNGEIADKLFVSLSTIKTHSSNLFVKLDARRRTQAVEKAKRLKIIA